jgi:glycosyltransferase-like protein
MRSTLASRPELADFDVLHAHDGIGANALADLRECGLIRGYLRTVHHVDRFADPRVQALEARSIRAASGVLCVSEVWQQRLRDEFGISAARVTNGVDLARFVPERSSRDQQLAQRLGLRAHPVVLTVGGIEARKNTRALLQAFISLRRRLPSAQLVIAGGASLLDHDAETRRFADEAAAADLRIGVGQPIVPAGVLTDDEMPALYRLADVLAMPSLLEGFGLAALEARACGTPAVVSERPPFTEHFGAGDVHWCDPQGVESIAQALLRAVAQRERQRPAVCARFGWPASAARHVDLYRAFQEEKGDARDALPAALAG